MYVADISKVVFIFYGMLISVEVFRVAIVNYLG